MHLVNVMTLQHNTAERQEAHEDVKAATVPDKPTLLPFYQRARALNDQGYGDLLLPIIPSGAVVSGQSKPAVGKVPGEWTGTSWRNAWGWSKAPPANIGAWKSWPIETGVGVRTGGDSGGVVGFDIDIDVEQMSTDAHDVKARQLAGEIRRVLAEQFGLPPNRLPRRERSNSTSSMIFARTDDELYKRVISFDADGRRHKLEFLATGQQVVVSGWHHTGVAQTTNLIGCKLSDLPRVDERDVSALFDRIKAKAEALGYAVNVGPAQKPVSNTDKVRDPVMRAVLEHRKDWLPDVLGLGLNVGDGELRVNSDHLGRDLQEALTIYSDGIYDFGTRRAHDPVSLICEFGEIDDDGDIGFGGSPDYQTGDGEIYEAADDEVRRPTPAQAVTWLCRRLGGENFPSYAGSPDWKSVSMTVAQAMGYRNEDLQIARVFDFVEWQGLGRREPGTWDADEIRVNGRLLSAVRIANPAAYSYLLDRWISVSNNGLSLARIEELIVEGFQDIPLAIEPTPKPPSDLKPVEWIDPCSDWEGVEARPREWEVEGWIPRGEVTLLYGDGGIGKTLLAQQYATCAASGRSWLGQITRPARVMCVFCEDNVAELHRRQIDINRSLGIGFSDLRNMRLVSRNFQNNFITTFDRKSQTLAKTAFWHQIRDDAIAFDADVLILDTIADIYAGSEIDRVQVNDFVKRFLGGLATAIGGSVIALGHPSAAGKSSGEGTSGSTGWNNASRSRLYLEYPGKAKNGDVRQLTNKKLNYGAKGAGLKLRWNRGAFDVMAGSMPAAMRDGNAIIPPSLDDAAENAVVSAIIECAGDMVPMSRATNSQYYAPKLLKARAADVLAAFNADEVADALGRLEGRGAIRLDEIGRKSGRAIMSFIVVPDKLAGANGVSGSVFG